MTNSCRASRQPRKTHRQPRKTRRQRRQTRRHHLSHAPEPRSNQEIARVAPQRLKTNQDCSSRSLALAPYVDRRCSSMLARSVSLTRMELRRYAMLARVRDFGQAHRDVFPESSAGGVRPTLGRALRCSDRPSGDRRCARIRRVMLRLAAPGNADDLFPCSARVSKGPRAPRPAPSRD